MFLNFADVKGGLSICLSCMYVCVCMYVYMYACMYSVRISAQKPSAK